MTLKELYTEIDGDYEQAMRVLRVEKLVDKHIRKFPANAVVNALMAAGKTMDPTGLFEAAHGLKGVAGNLGLARLSAMAGEITEEFRPGSARTLSDAQVTEKLSAIKESFDRAVDGIRRYTEE